MDIALGLANGDRNMRQDLAVHFGEERLPRYTSYPTAPHFSSTVDSCTYAAWLAAIPREATASLYLHVPFCRSMCWYCGCHTQVSRDDEPIVAYARALRSEIELVRRRVGRSMRVDQIHFGGGTPTIVGPKLFADLLGTARCSFLVSPAAEIAVELDPRVLDRAMIETLGRCGVTRASFGIQSFDPVVQSAINRMQTFEQTAAATDAVRAAGVARVNFDLLYGLPGQSVASCSETVRLCLTLRPDRFSVFGYAHVPSFKVHQRKIDAAALPNGLERHHQFEEIAGRLQDAGYRRIGLDHFCLPDDPLALAQDQDKLRRNFQGYTDDQTSVLIGLGASAIGKLPQGHLQNEVGARAYISRVAGGRLATAKGYALTPDDRARGEIIERIMCHLNVDIAQVCRRHGYASGAIVPPSTRLRDLVSKGAVTFDGERLSVTENARFLVRSVAAAFDAYLDSSGSKHSRAV
jgi:oxygen-independent coproporphyrinogen-3 oxidase